MPDPVEIAFHQAARKLLAPRSVILAAVSGGGDSVALLRLLHRYTQRRDDCIVVAHLDHGLRKGSASDRKFVERLALALDLPCIGERRPVRTLRRRDESPEEAARRVRREFLLEAMRRSGATVIATGHTLNDQAETILMRLARGAGPAALTGITPKGPGPFVRPLLQLERGELRAYLRRKRFDFIEDPSNEDPRFPRNRIRNEVLPLLAEAVNPKAGKHIVEAADRTREDLALLDHLAERAFARMADVRQHGRRVALRVKPLIALDHALAKRVVRTALQSAGADPRRISAKHVTAVLALAMRGSRASIDLPALTATQALGTLLLSRTTAKAKRR